MYGISRGEAITFSLYHITTNNKQDYSITSQKRNSNNQDESLEKLTIK